MIRDAIVMAAGEGRRLRPLTVRYAKAVLPIDGRPVIGTLLRELAAAGVERATVVTGHLAEQVERLAGSGFPLEVRFVRQPRRDGSADAVRLGIARGFGELPTLALAADTVFSPGDLARFAAAAEGADGAIAVRRSPPPEPGHRDRVRVEDGRVTRVLDDDEANPLGGAPLWMLGEEIARRLCLDARPYELAQAFRRAVDEGITIRGIEIGRTRDLTRPVDLVERNFPYLRHL